MEHQGSAPAFLYIPEFVRMAGPRCHRELQHINYIHFSVAVFILRQELPWCDVASE